MSKGDGRSLISLVKHSGRIADAASLAPLFQSLTDMAASKGLSEGFVHRAVSSVLETADPPAALNRLARVLSITDDPNFLSLMEDPDGLRSLLSIFGYSNFLSSLIIRSPENYVWLMREVGLAGTRYSSSMREELEGKIRGDVSIEDASLILRANKYREMLRIGARDLLGVATLEETVHDISNLAEASIDVSVQVATTHLKARHGIPLHVSSLQTTRPGKFCVLGMGKLGGEELNYSSDVDLFYLYSSHEGMTTGRRSASGGYRDAIDNHRFYVKLGETVTHLLNERTAEGMVFRVDLRLRPEGEAGEIAYSLSSLEVYYQSWGRTTDRLALLKARPVGGDQRLGEDFLDLMTPFIYRRHLDYTAIEEIGLLKEKIDRQVSRAPPGVTDIKLGRGGIREIEFLVQSLQLIHGGRNPAIREKNTLRALDRLMRNGFLTERDASTLRDAYIFLRTVEHRVQLVEERQIHTLPRDPEGLERLAYVMGFFRDGRGDPDAFDGTLSRVAGNVRTCYERLFFTEKGHGATEGTCESNLLRENLTREEAVNELKTAGFSDPEEGYRNLLLLRDGPAYGHFSDVCRNLLRRIAPRLLDELKSVPNPDAVLVNLNRFIGRVGARASYYSMLAGNPESIRLLAVLFGSSPFLSSLLIRQPDLLDLMVMGTDLSASKPAEIMEDEVRGVLLSSPSFEDELVMLRRYRNGEIFRIGLGDLLGLRDLPGINGELTLLAETLLQTSFDLAVRHVVARGEKPSGSFGVVAMGKMGGGEMNYSSDLDLIFLFEGAEKEREDYTRVAQRMITILTSPTGEGVLYRIDMRLRPSGHSGPLVTTLEAFRRYHLEEAMVWERQALIKARWVAGNRELSHEIEKTLDELIYTRPAGRQDLSEIMRVRQRMENEIADEGKGDYLDIKAGRGGLVDIEFAVQALQLTYGKRYPRIRSTSTFHALDSIRETGLVDEKQYNILRRSYLFYREIEDRSHLHSDRPDHRVPLDEEKVKPLARTLGYTGKGEKAGEFLHDVQDTREQVRKAYQDILGRIIHGCTGG
ncbi:MAG: bifunctional [glutamate--ammonia ligase]-adenylyl-L-tyrosine phosphorylase/[glutamate--ammonia-ligase] adenylyltransferase [Deltaproteobacteria bacterium]|nr:bifunctional [glutamate--ammonia ligase]-adenylyl-L-tyrosine phosphorylase/[glutamate--ammonia-ligase] adenylyltransferase [Deltaproteobacteria bacterium]